MKIANYTMLVSQERAIHTKMKSSCVAVVSSKQNFKRWIGSYPEGMHVTPSINLTLVFDMYDGG